MGFDNAPPGKRARIDSSPHHSSAAVTASEQAAGSSVSPAWRPQEPVVGTTNALRASMGQRSAESIEAFFNRIDSDRRAASSQANAARASSYPTSHGGLAPLLNDNPAAYSMDDNEIATSTENQTGSNPAGEFVAAFTVSGDELARIEPVTDPNVCVSQMPGPSGLAQSRATRPELRDAESEGGNHEQLEDELSDSSDEESLSGDEPATTAADVEIMDMATSGRPIKDMFSPQRKPYVPPPLVYFTALKDAENLRSRISDKDIHEFFGSYFSGKNDSRKKILAFWRVLDENNMARLIDLSWVPKQATGGINWKFLGEDLDLGRFYFKKLRKRYLDERMKKPRWMYKVLKRFSLEGGLPPPEQTVSSRSLMHPGVPKPTYSIALKKARELEPEISNDEMFEFFGDCSPGDKRRMILAFLRVCFEHNVKRLIELPGFPEHQGRVNRAVLAKGLGLSPHYFKGVLSIVNQHLREGTTVPRWASVMMEGLCLGEPTTYDNAVTAIATSDSVAAAGPARPLSPDAGPGAVPKLSYLLALEKARELTPDISDDEVFEYFGNYYVGRNNSRTKLLAFLRVLNENKVERLVNLDEFPKGARGNVDSQALATNLGLGDRYFHELRKLYRRHTTGKAPRWVYEVLKRFSLEKDLTPPGQTASRQGLGGYGIQSAVEQPVSATSAAMHPAGSAMPGPSRLPQVPPTLENASYNVPIADDPAVPGALRPQSTSLWPATQPRISYATAMKEARELQSSISEEDMNHFYGNRYANDNRRKVLALLFVLKKHGVERIIDLEECPEVEKGRVNQTVLARNLDLAGSYFRGLRRDMLQHVKNHASTPNWMIDVMEKLCLK